MSEQPRTRQELYDQIRATSKQTFILEEMIRLGFWAEDEAQPSEPKQLLDKRKALRGELQKLALLQHKVQNPALLLKEYRKKRLAESRQKQQENREKRAAERKERAAAWKKRKSEEIVHLGEDISAGLVHKISDVEKLGRYALPVLHKAPDLAEAMGISIGQLRFLAYNKKISKCSHYKQFFMPKKSGGKRLISAPMPRLKSAQYWVLSNILYKVPVHNSAHGFKPEHSIVSNAAPHVKQDVVINFDFQDFFPTVTFRRVKGVFTNLGYSEHIATILAALCTEAHTEKVVLDNETYYVAMGERYLPQGAPTSPALTNILCYKLDARLLGAAQKLGFNYSRYADDLSFSASGDAAKNNVKTLLWQVKKITAAENFVLHPDKLRIMRKHKRQEVTGIVVNEHLSVDRKTLRRFRALLHQIEQTGLKGKTWGTGANLVASIRGYAQFVAMVKPQKGNALVARTEAVLRKAGVKKKSVDELSQQIKRELNKK